MRDWLTSTWRFWHLLKKPPLDPARVRQQLLGRSTQKPVVGWVVGGVVLYYIGLSAYTNQTPISGFVGRPLVGFVSLTMPLILLALAFSGSAYGIGWTVRISEALQRARSSGLFTHLAATPMGRGGATWMVAVSVLHRDGILTRIPDAEAPLTPPAARLVVGLLLLALFVPMGRAALFPLLNGTALFLFVYVDYVQSCCVAVLVGTLAGLRAEGTAARWWALAVFVGVQLTTYGLMWVVVGWAFPLAGLERFGMMGIPQLWLFYLIREPVILGLWRLNNVHFFPEKLIG